MAVDKCEYPTADEMGDYQTKWVPESLQLFLSHLFPSKLKQISLAQCISQASRPRSMVAPIPFGIGVYVDKSFGTCWLVDHLAKVGFSMSSDEWVADNVDHNIQTLIGKGTFHGMGITSISSSKPKDETIKRLKHNETKDLSFPAVKILPYDGSSCNGLRELQFKPVKDRILGNILAPEMNLDLVWHAS
ncbi:uncharacterized protein LOC130623163 [Hydractinia symbiolongicarpus]|uniref:uncharacterized protein LOC130623163 n=1 Tax=Hydractinia symbiolongicarpus TaxID=13093 RepID=UPI00254A5DC2|nr:uncharacterized protein LOC130623163 [Hydractinia symbiolongicarpus]